jgi:hypothetical protein
MLEIEDKCGPNGEVESGRGSFFRREREGTRIESEKQDFDSGKRAAPARAPEAILVGPGAGLHWCYLKKLTG